MRFKLTRGRTGRGFRMWSFKDAYGAACSITKSSLATDDAIWLGIDDANPQVLASQASRLGVQTTETTGWVPYPVPEDVLLNTHMHLTRKQVKRKSRSVLLTAVTPPPAP